MPETKQPAEDKRGTYQSFIAHYNLSPLNNDAIMNCLFEHADEIRKLKEYIYGGRTVTIDGVRQVVPTQMLG